ncbi:MAG: tetratricopeptide repeat protein [Myxococcales bacterium]|nr:tetratricopeptide repeat protein [Myxococcales bacterium]
MGLTRKTTTLAVVAALSAAPPALAFDCIRAADVVAAAAEERDPTAREARLREALELCPQEGRARVLLGDLYRDRGEHARAREAYARAAVLSPNATLARERLRALDQAESSATKAPVHEPPAVIAEILGAAPAKTRHAASGTSGPSEARVLVASKRPPPRKPVEVEVIRPSFGPVEGGGDLGPEDAASPPPADTARTEGGGVLVLRAYEGWPGGDAESPEDAEPPGARVIEISPGAPAAAESAPRRRRAESLPEGLAESPRAPRTASRARARGVEAPRAPSSAAPRTATPSPAPSAPASPIDGRDTPLACVRADDLYEEGRALSDGSLGEEFAYQKALELCPSHVASLNALGAVYVGRGDWKEAAERFKRAVDLKPDYAKAWFNLSAVYEHEGDRARALSALEQVVRRDPAYAKAYPRLAELYVEAGRSDDAIAAYRKLLDQGGDPATRFRLGVLLWNRGQKTEGAQLVQAAVTQDPGLLERPEARLIVKDSF